MRGPAAPTSPGAWDARSEALLGAPAVDAEPTPSGIAPGATGTLPTLDLHADPAPLPGGETALDDLLSAFGPPRPTPHARVPGEEPEDAPEPEAATGAAEDAPEPAPVPEPDPEPEPEPESVPAPGGAVAPGPGAAWGEPPAPAAVSAPAPAPGKARRSGGDPVKVLLHRHRELCERAVDPLEVAAGLEAQGFTDRTAARYRHRDVFSLAEELYARVPRAHREAAPDEDAEAPRAPWALAACAPGAAAALLVPALLHLDGAARLVTAAAGAAGLAAALALAVRRGPLHAPAAAPATPVWTLWLLAYAVAGDGLLEEVLRGGPDGAWRIDPAPLLGLALAVAPAAWCAHLFAGRARRHIAESRGLADFATATRAWLLAAVLLHLAALTALLALTGLTAGALALGALLLTARLLAVHGHGETAAAALAAACAAEALGLASVLAARLPLPGFDALAVPVRTTVDAWGAGALPALVCGAAALGLLAHATGALTRASAHTTP
ncbi:hypothetical protein [Streptomyces roseolus]|uniref:hypothetical protein n=1 Tax=Streptomyces roseolus TaxID=67358 RepID=UPI00198C1899|nr:hypothetical protein [Streptomyces roseolus]GGR29187.1 hypothetical protein GCM10010282_22100 [Streptomyces roseolus]